MGSDVVSTVVTWVMAISGVAGALMLLAVVVRFEAVNDRPLAVWGRRFTLTGVLLVITFLALVFVRFRLVGV